MYFDRNAIDPFKERTVKEFSTPEDSELKNNVYYHAKDNQYVVDFLKERQGRGWEKGSASFDPEFKNPIPRFRNLKASDFDLSDDSRVFEKDFKNIDVSDIGIRDDFPVQLRFLVDPLSGRVLISGDAKFEASSINEAFSVNPEDLSSQQGDEEVNVVLHTEEEGKPFLFIDMKDEKTFDAFKILAPMNADREQLRTLTVWISPDGSRWRQVWKADSYHVEMPRSFDKVFEQSVSCRYVKIGLREEGALVLKSVQLYSN